MKLTDVLLVTQSCREREINFISTIDEFIAEQCVNDSPEVADMLRRIVNDARPYQWDGFYAAEENKTFEMRFCQSQEDLLEFLSGKYNDSVEKMETRLPGTAGMYSSWNWYNSPEMFSERAVEFVENYARGLGIPGQKFKYDLYLTMPDFPFEKASTRTRGTRLADLIKQAEASKPLQKVSRLQLARGNSLEF